MDLTETHTKGVSNPQHLSVPGVTTTGSPWPQPWPWVTVMKTRTRGRAQLKNGVQEQASQVCAGRLALAGSGKQARLLGRGGTGCPGSPRAGAAAWTPRHHPRLRWGALLHLKDALKSKIPLLKCKNLFLPLWKNLQQKKKDITIVTM